MSYLIPSNIKSKIRYNQDRYGNVTYSPLGTMQSPIGPRDFILMTAVYTDSGIAAGSNIISLDTALEENHKINLADAVNSMGILSGNITLQYSFLRCEAGSHQTVLIDRERNFYRDTVVTNNGKMYKNTVSPKGDPDEAFWADVISSNEDIEEFRVFSKRFTYEISNISPARDEIEVKLKNGLTGNTFYQSQFDDFKTGHEDKLSYKSDDISYQIVDTNKLQAWDASSMAAGDPIVSFGNSPNVETFSDITVEIPKAFKVSTREEENITVTREVYMEPKPVHVPSAQQSQESSMGQWVYVIDWSGDSSSPGSWLPNSEGLEITDEGAVLYPNRLITGMPLDIASNVDKFNENSNSDITTSLIPGWSTTNDAIVYNPSDVTTPTTTTGPIDISNDAAAAGEEDSYINKIRFSDPFKTWFNNNVNGLFHHPKWGAKLPSDSQLLFYFVEKGDSGTFREIQGMMQLLVSEFLTSIEDCVAALLADYMYIDPNPTSAKYFREVENKERVMVTDYAPYRAKLIGYDREGDKVSCFNIKHDYEGEWDGTRRLAQTIEEAAEVIGITYESINTDIKEINFYIGAKQMMDLTYYAVVGQSTLHLIINKLDLDDTMVLKLYNPLSNNVQLGDDIYFTREVTSHREFDLNLNDFTQPIIPDTILRLPSGTSVGEPIVRNRSTEYQNWDDLLFKSSSLAQDIERDIVSGSVNQVRLNMDYSNYDKFMKFGSAEKRLENFKTKLGKIELHNAYSQSIAGTYYDTGYLGNDPNTAIASAGTDARKWETANSEVINSFDGYERYLYFESSSFKSGSSSQYSSASVDLLYDASWPKKNTTKPYILSEITSSDAVTWYNNQIISASDFDHENRDRLLYHLPEHIRDDTDNTAFTKFVDMTGHHFDNIKNYIDRFGQIYEIDEQLDKGLSKQLIYSVAKGFGWNLQDGYDLAKLDKFFFGKSVDKTNSATTLYASSSLQDISREVWKRIIANMPLFLKSRGTIESLKGLINCYGIPSTILRVREYGGPTITDVEPIYETSRKFTKALDFKASQYVSGSWSHSLGLGNAQTANSMEFRFKAASSSDQTLVQGGNGATGDQFGIHLKDNGSADNIGRLSFSLSGSAGYVTASTEPLPFYNGDFWSVMLAKETVTDELLRGEDDVTNLFETGSLQRPFKDWVAGTAEIVSGSTEVYTGKYAIKVTQTGTKSGDGSFGTFSRPSINDNGKIDAYGDARFVTASMGEEYEFSVYAKTGNVNGGQLQFSLSELSSDGSHISSRTYGTVVTKKWKLHTFRIGVRKKATAHVGLKLFFRTNSGLSNRTIFLDGGKLTRIFDERNEVVAGANNVVYNLVAKQYDAGRDVIQYTGNARLDIPGDQNAASASYNTAYNNTGSLYIGGYTTNNFGGQFSGSMMEFRIWKSRLDEKYFDEHVENPQSYAGNSVSASFQDIALRYSFNESKNHNSDTTVRDTSTDQSSPIAGIATGFADETSYSSVVDRTKFPLPKLGGIRRNSNKIRIEKAHYLDRIGENINLSPTNRVEISSYDRAPLDLSRVGVYFSPADVINQDIMDQLSDFNFDQYLGDSRDDEEYQYRDLDKVKSEYFKKYTGANNFWDYLRLINYFDHSLFTQLESLLPARSKAVVGVLLENNILERNKQPIKHPTFENIVFEDTIKLEEDDGGFVSSSAENNYLEVTQNVTRLDREIDEDSSYEMFSDNQYYESTISGDIFSTPSLRDLNRVDTFGHFGRNYTTASIYMGGPTTVFTEAITTINNQRPSQFNKKPMYIYNSKENFLQGTAASVSYVTSSFEKITENSTGLRRINFEGSKNTVTTALSSLDVNGKKDYTPVTYILTNPYALVGDARDSVQLRTEFDTGNEND